MPRIAKTTPSDKSALNLGFEAKLWLAADKLRVNSTCSRAMAWPVIVVNAPLGHSFCVSGL